MKLTKDSQSGFGILPALLLIVIICIIGATGWYVYKATKSTKSTLNNVASSQTTVQTSTTSSKGAPSTQQTVSANKYTTQQAITFVENTYEKYDNYVQTATNLNHDSYTDTIKSDLSPSLYTAIHNAYMYLGSSTQDQYDVITCDQLGGIPSVSLISNSGSTAKIQVNITQASSGYAGMPVIITTVDLNSLLITSISCNV